MRKIIYQPKGAAAEYASWAANLYNGCSARCSYCYNRNGRFSNVLGGDVPTLKKSAGSNNLEVVKNFLEDLRTNLHELREHGLFFSFVSDPMLRETIELNTICMREAIIKNINVKVLTKQAWWVDDMLEEVKTNGSFWNLDMFDKIAFGFTLTGFDALEPGAATNQERIEALRKLKKAGFKTFVSLEPVIDFGRSKGMIQETLMYCDFYKIGLQSGKFYDKRQTQSFVEWLSELVLEPKIYLKESLRKLSGYENFELGDNFADRNFDMFKIP